MSSRIGSSSDIPISVQLLDQQIESYKSAMDLYQRIGGRPEVICGTNKLLKQAILLRNSIIQNIANQTLA